MAGETGSEQLADERSKKFEIFFPILENFSNFLNKKPFMEIGKIKNILFLEFSLKNLVKLEMENLTKLFLLKDRAK